MHKRVKQQTRRARRPGIEEIEPRILYSADFAPALVPDTGLDTHAEQRTVDSSGEFNQASTQQAQTLRHEIVFVDAATPDYEKLIGDIRAQGGGREIEVVLLDAGKDGITQITKTLAGREDIGAVHIVSHGADGSVQLGKTSLDFDSLLKNSIQDQGLGQRPDRRRRHPDLRLQRRAERQRALAGRGAGALDRRGRGGER